MIATGNHRLAVSRNNPVSFSARKHPPQSVGGVAKLLFSSSSKPLPKRHILPLTPFYQGHTNGCGTTSLAMVLNALLPNKGYTQAILDAKYRIWNVGKSPHQLRAIARKEGLFSEVLHQLSFETIQNHLTHQRYVIPLFQTNRAVWTALHFSVIHGYQDHPDPSKRQILITNPARKFQPTYWMNFDEFCQNQWNDLILKPNATVSWQNRLLEIPKKFSKKFREQGYNTQVSRLAVVVSANNDLPPSKDLPLLFLQTFRVFDNSAIVLARLSRKGKQLFKKS